MADLKDQELDTPGIQIRQFTDADDFVNTTDLATWDMAISCGGCHIGGSVVEFDRNDVRHSQRDMSMTYNAIDYYVDEMFDGYGLPAHLENGAEVPGFAPAPAPWAYPAQMNGGFVTAEMMDMMADGEVGGAAYGPGWATGMEGADVTAGDLMMPNVREMDCFFCHFKGFNNIISSVATQMGYLSAAPSMASGMLNMFSQTYMPNSWKANPAIPVDPSFGTPAMLSDAFLNNLQGEPLQENCRQCHTPTTMENFSSMFDEFLAVSPMTYDPLAPGASQLNGMVMPSYDLNGQFFPSNASTPEVVMNAQGGWEYSTGAQAGQPATGPFGLFPMAMDSSWYLGSPAKVGGGVPGATGPLYYATGVADDGVSYAAMLEQDPAKFAPGLSNQNTWKKSTIPFPRADFFKRGDIWDNAEQEVHYAFGCAGCHYNTNSDNPALNQCDPGRGRTRMGGVESGQKLNGGTTSAAVLENGLTAQNGTALPQTTGVDTHDTVKSCQECHITGKNIYGNSIETFGAPNPNAKHADAGLLAMVTTARSLDAGGNEVDVTGNHMDVIDCSVCHIYKEAMTVRALDSTSGNRYPTIEGIQNNKGMMSMFTDPFTEANLSDAEALQWFESFMSGMGYTGGTNIGNDTGAIEMMYGHMLATYGMDAVTFARSQLHMDPVEWKPIYGWHANTPKYLGDGVTVNPDWRRKLVPINFITAQMWDDANGTEDQNGDSAELRGLANIQWDPPISRDMKVGMNFAPGPFATIPVGFGSGEFQSAYDMSTFAFNGKFQFVGLYGGNIMLTTPEEISGYKAYRAGLKAMSDGAGGITGINKSWADTELVFQGGNPFQVTHNVVETEKHALGKKVNGAYGCNQCHAPDAGFFSGAYDMTGTAVPASATYQVQDPMGLPTLDIASTMMYRPAIDYEVVAVATDLRTGSEAKDKATGAVLDVEFDVLGCYDNTVTGSQTDAEGNTYVAGFIEAVGVHDPAAVDCSAYDDVVYKRTTDLSRSAMLYPDEAHHDPAQLALDIAALESIDPADYGIGVIPSVDTTLAGVSGVTASDGVSTYYETNAGGTGITIDVAGTGDAAFTYNTYYQNIADGSDAGTAAADGSIVFPEAGTYRIVTEAVNIEGKMTKDIKYVVVAAALVGDFAAPTVSVDGLSGDITVTLNLGATAPAYTSALVNWADGTAQNHYVGAEALTNVYPAAMTGETVRVNVALYDGTDVAAAWATDVTLP